MTSLWVHARGRPAAAPGEGWDTLCEAAVEDVDALPKVESAIARTNAFVERIEEARA